MVILYAEEAVGNSCFNKKTAADIRAAFKTSNWFNFSNHRSINRAYSLFVQIHKANDLSLVCVRSAFDN